MHWTARRHSQSDLDLWPFNSKTVPLLGYSKMIPYTKFEHFRIIRFELFSRQTNKQTNRRTRRIPSKLSVRIAMPWCRSFTSRTYSSRWQTLHVLECSRWNGRRTTERRGRRGSTSQTHPPTANSSSVTATPGTVRRSHGTTLSSAPPTTPRSFRSKEERSASLHVTSACEIVKL